MGRQAYLDKIAFGRSAFEPTSCASQSSGYVQLESAQSEIPARYHEATANNYMQLYDERGNPINPRSHQYGKKLRGAQNDVLASVGVVERRRSPAEGLPGSSEERIQLLEAEDTMGNAVALATTFAENICTWWIGTIRDRLLTFRYHHGLTFSQIVNSECALSGTSIMYAGFAPRVFAALNIQTAVYSVFMYQPIERLLHATRASARTRNVFRRTRRLLRTSLRVGLEILCCPFYYHTALQRLGLVPARPLLPSWRTLIPFALSSPLLPAYLPQHATNSFADRFAVFFFSPAIILCSEHILERWVYACVYEAVESSIIRPDKPDTASRDVNGKDRALTVLGLRRESPRLIRNGIHKILWMLGWASPLAASSTERKQTAGVNETRDMSDAQTIHVGGTRVTNATPLSLPVVQTQDQRANEPLEADVITMPVSAVDELMRSTSPPGSTADSEEEENDPRIRITSREGIVEMEVRLPPRTLSSHSEVAETFGSPREGRRSESVGAVDLWEKERYHRVTQLSCEPAQMIGAMVRAQLVGLAMLPIRMLTLQTIALHYLSRQGRQGGPHRMISSLEIGSDLSVVGISRQVLRVALCGALEMAVDLGLWQMQYLAITKLGRELFGWGTL
ncbi:hypothetical protein COCCADRAFT_32265 [Bipolaris zeicola 26-R-13]|uniref:Uncharacterized protein n=1 Tax=Cochliobolus carbonum (strain 26-R-13) TaxID=930089 RepID=W6Z4I1_COCC2|nr:uncharacterized protein COCCADRAFT_32265 [Bipolaris zeicola 26-R-13]EUC38606.1 hypothetical protein COCCADRAFT_32265 [Bipolaris zeicola 26-R-13]